MIDSSILFFQHAKPWLSALGLFFDMVGAWFLTKGLIISEDEALELGLSYWSSDKREESLKDARVQDRLKQSKNAKIGLIFLLIGFSLQLLGSLPFGK
jgi:hypothetical protein